jgi:hypothetical protein
MRFFTSINGMLMEMQWKSPIIWYNMWCGIDMDKYVLIQLIMTSRRDVKASMRTRVYREPCSNGREFQPFSGYK